MQSFFLFCWLWNVDRLRLVHSKYTKNVSTIDWKWFSFIFSFSFISELLWRYDFLISIRQQQHQHTHRGPIFILVIRCHQMNGKTNGVYVYELLWISLFFSFEPKPKLKVSHFYEYDRDGESDCNWKWINVVLIFIKLIGNSCRRSCI